jgi:hypothetical protein
LLYVESPALTTTNVLWHAPARLAAAIIMAHFARPVAHLIKRRRDSPAHDRGDHECMGAELIVSRKPPKPSHRGKQDLGKTRCGNARYITGQRDGTVPPNPAPLQQPCCRNSSRRDARDRATCRLDVKEQSCHLRTKIHESGNEVQLIFGACPCFPMQENCFPAPLADGKTKSLLIKLLTT